MRTNRAGAAAAAVALLVVLVATLVPAPGTPSTAEFWCIACGELGAVDVVANIALFLPLGFALVLATNHRWAAVLGCIATTVLVEMLQIRVVVGRDASLSDLLANSLGGWLGAELALQRHMLWRPDGKHALRLSVGSLCVFAAVCAATSWGLRPAEVPRSLWVQWSPPRSSYEPFTGRLLAFDIDGIDLPLGFPSPALRVNEHLESDRWHATATIARDGLAPVRSILVRVSEEYTLLVAIEQDGWNLTCQQKTRSSDFRFRSPRVALPNAFRLSAGARPDIERVMCGRRDGSLAAAASVGSDRAEQDVRLSPSLGWLLLSPFDFAIHGVHRWVGALWLFALAFPAGFWGAAVGEASRSRPSPSNSRRGRLVVAAAAAASLGIAFIATPSLAGTAPAAWWEWAAGTCGLAAGLVLAPLAWRGRRGYARVERNTGGAARDADRDVARRS